MVTLLFDLTQGIETFFELLHGIIVRTVDSNLFVVISNTPQEFPHIHFNLFWNVIQVVVEFMFGVLKYSYLN